MISHGIDPAYTPYLKGTPMKRRSVTICALVAVFALGALAWNALDAISNPAPAGDWNPTQENTTSGLLIGVDVSNSTFTIEHASWCASADKNDVDGVVVFTMTDPEELHRLDREVPAGTHITVTHDRLPDVVSDAGQLQAQSYCVSEVLPVSSGSDSHAITVGTLTSIDADARTLTIEQADWTACADCNDAEGTVVFGVRGNDDVAAMFEGLPVGSRIAVTHNRAEHVVSDAGQLACLHVEAITSTDAS